MMKPFFLFIFFGICVADCSFSGCECIGSFPTRVCAVDSEIAISGSQTVTGASFVAQENSVLSFSLPGSTIQVTDGSFTVNPGATVAFTAFTNITNYVFLTTTQGISNQYFNVKGTKTATCVNPSVLVGPLITQYNVSVTCNAGWATVTKPLFLLIGILLFISTI